MKFKRDLIEIGFIVFLVCVMGLFFYLIGSAIQNTFTIKTYCKNLGYQGWESDYSGSVIWCYNIVNNSLVKFYINQTEVLGQ